MGKQPLAIAITPDADRLRGQYGLRYGDADHYRYQHAWSSDQRRLADSRATSLRDRDHADADRIRPRLQPAVRVSHLNRYRACREAALLGPVSRAIAITPDGKPPTSCSASTVTPIDVATNKAEPPIKIGGNPAASCSRRTARPPTSQPDRGHRDTDFGGHEHGGHPDQNRETARDRDNPRREDGLCRQPQRRHHADLHRHQYRRTPIKVCASLVQQIAITPDGKATYVACSSDVTPVLPGHGPSQGTYQGTVWSLRARYRVVCCPLVIVLASVPASPPIRTLHFAQLTFCS